MALGPVDAGPMSVAVGVGVDVGVARAEVMLAISSCSRSSGTRPVSTSRAGLRRVSDGPSTRMLSFCSSTSIPRSDARWRAEDLGGTGKRLPGVRAIASARQAAPESTGPGEQPAPLWLDRQDGLIAGGTRHLTG
jgi:hypothetical protein